MRIDVLGLGEVEVLENEMVVVDTLEYEKVCVVEGNIVAAYDEAICDWVQLGHNEN